MANLRRSPYSPSRRLRSSRSSRSRSRPIIFTLGSIVAFSAISLIYLTHSTVWNEALRKLDIFRRRILINHTFHLLHYHVLTNNCSCSSDWAATVIISGHQRMMMRIHIRVREIIISYVFIGHSSLLCTSQHYI